MAETEDENRERELPSSREHPPVRAPEIKSRARVVQVARAVKSDSDSKLPATAFY